MSKSKSFLRRSILVRKKIVNSLFNRLCVYRSNRYVYCQIFSSKEKNVLISKSSIDLNLRNYIFLNYGKFLNKSICCFIGRCLALTSLSLGVYSVVFDRSGYKYHGCIKSLAESAKKFGLKF